MKALAQILDTALERSQTEPTSLAERRLAAAAGLKTHGLPTLRDEAWKYTSLSSIAELPFRLATAVDSENLTAQELSALDPASRDDPRIVFVNGHYRRDLSTLPQAPDGVSVRSLAEVLTHQSEILADVVDAADFNAFTELNTATVADGIVIDVADDQQSETALALIFVGAGEAPLLRAPRVLIRAGRHSRVRVTEEYLSQERDHGLTNVVTHIDLGEGAEVNHHRLQSEAPGSAHIGRVIARVGSNAVFHSDSVAFGGQLTRVDIDVALHARGGRCRLNGLFVGRGEQHIDHHTTIDHQVGDTHSEELYRGILDDRSRGVFNGKVIVREQAQKISARQASNNLLLSRSAEIDTKPELEIYADDVTCAHGATVGELDRTALFYLRSRGISEADARALVIHAFAEEVIAAIPLEGLRKAIERRFIGHHAMSELIASINK